VGSGYQRESARERERGGAADRWGWAVRRGAGAGIAGLLGLREERGGGESGRGLGRIRPNRGGGFFPFSFSVFYFSFLFSITIFFLSPFLLNNN
jgi:hypothetical protein